MTERIGDFMTTHARLLDRRRAELALGAGDADATLSALAAYRNPDGGFGWALEPDLRAPVSQPVGAYHALEVFEDVAPASSPMAAALCDWLAGVTLPGGGLPFALAGAASPGTAPFWAEADPAVPSLQITSLVAALAHRVARHDPAVAGHAWLPVATDYCFAAMEPITEARNVIELLGALQLLDAVHDTDARAPAELARLAGLVPRSGTLPVPGGAAGEALRPLDFSPRPARPLRGLLDPAAIDADLDRLAGEQQPDGGWEVDWVERSPAGGLEWRGWATVRAVRVLRANGRL
jgi:hypothetical protein